MKTVVTETVELSKEEIETIRKCWNILDELTDRMANAGFSEKDGSSLDVATMTLYNLQRLIVKLNLY